MYAVIIADLNSSALGRIVSTHKTQDGAERAIDKIDDRGAYIAQRKADGEWERRLEARDRRESGFCNAEQTTLLKLIAQGGYTQRGAARELGISERMMRYYCAGEQPVPRVVMLALTHLVECPTRGNGYPS
jgi:hypothetical protein